MKKEGEVWAKNLTKSNSFNLPIGAIQWDCPAPTRYVKESEPSDILAPAHNGKIAEPSI